MASIGPVAPVSTGSYSCRTLSNVTETCRVSLGSELSSPASDTAWLDVLEGIERPKVFVDSATGIEYRAHADAILAGHEDWVSSVRRCPRCSGLSILVSGFDVNEPCIAQ
jgi:hypothetical protein